MKITSINLLDNNGDRKIEVTISNGTVITIVACQESWEQYGGTLDELYLTADVTERYNKWLHGGDL